MNHSLPEPDDAQVNAATIAADPAIEPAILAIDHPADRTPPSSSSVASINIHCEYDRASEDNFELGAAPRALQAAATETAVMADFMTPLVALSVNPTYDEATESAITRHEESSGEAVSIDPLKALLPLLSQISSRTVEQHESGSSQLDFVPDIGRSKDPLLGAALAQNGLLLLEHVKAAINSAGLDRAIEILRDALIYLPEKHPTTLTVLSSLGGALVFRFDSFSNVNVDDLEQAISQLSRAIDLALHRESAEIDPSGALSEPLYNLGNAFLKRFHRLGEVHDLEQAVALQLCLVDLMPDDDPNLPGLLNNLGSAFQNRFDRLREIRDLEQAISLGLRSVKLTPDGHPGMPGRLTHLGSAFGTRFDCLGEMGDLEQAISLKSRSVDLTPNAHPNLPSRLSNFGSALLQRFSHLGEMGDLDRAVSLISRSVDLTPDGHPDIPTLLTNLGSVFKTRFQHLGEMRDLEQAISLMSRSVDLTPNGHPDIPNRLTSLSSAFQIRFDRLGEIGDLDQVISLKSRSVDLTPNGHPNLPSRLTNLSDAFKARFDRLGEIGDLGQAISLESRSVDLIPNDHPDMPNRLSDLGNAFSIRFQRLGEMSDLEQAISLRLRSVKLAPDDHPNMAILLSYLGSAFQTRFQRLGEMGDLEQAISLTSSSVDLTPNGHPSMAALLSNFGSALETCFVHTGEMSALEQALSLKSRSVELTPEGHPDMPNRLRNLGITFGWRFDRLGEIGDLGQAISLLSCSVDLTLDGRHPSMPDRLSDLGNLFERRFDRLGEIGDLERAISLMSRSVDLTPDDHPDMPNRLNNLGNAFHTRFLSLSEMSDLEQAVSLMSRSVDLTPNGHPYLPSRLSNLGGVFWQRFKRIGGMAGLEQTISLMSRSIDLTPDDHPNMPSRLRNLGGVYVERFDHLHEISDLDSAIQLRRRAVKLASTNSPDFPSHLNVLGCTLQKHFTSIGHSGSSPESVKCFEEAMTSNTGLSQSRLEAVEYLVDVYWHSDHPGDTPLYDKLVSAYEYAHMLIPEIVWLGSSVTRRYALLGDIRDVITGAAAAAISIGQATRAVEWMEQGRGIVWGQLLQLRSPMDELFEHHPDLAERLQHISRQLEKSANISDNIVFEENYDTSTDIIRQDETTRRIQLAQDYKQLLSQIRQLEGFDSFLTPKKYAEIARACDGGPIVLINGYESRYDALVCLSADQIIHVPLHRFYQEVIQPMFTNSSSFIGRARTWFDSQKLEERKAIPEAEADQDSGLTVLLSALWWHAVEPILSVIEAELHDHTDGVLPHITWCTTGIFSALPIHAAGDYTTPGGKMVFDRVVSSYAPTLSSLLRPPVRQVDHQSPSSKILAVSQPNTPGCNSLPGTVGEIAMLKKYFPGDEMVHLNHSEATVDTVLQLMDEHHCPYVHLACHGMQDAEDPTKSSFALYDGHLELGKLMSKSTDHATLAFLSACQTATGDVRLREESVHLAAGMLAVGYRGVIGTLWSIHDDDAPLVADEFYRALKERQASAVEGAKGGSQVHAAYALHEATKKLREQVGVSNVERWAPFMHFGR